MGTVRDKLQEDAKKDNLVFEMDESAEPAASQPEESNSSGKKKQGAVPAKPGVQKVLKAKEYRGELQKIFDEILSAVGDYFDLFKNNTDKLEALWLQLLDYVGVQNSN